MNRNDTIKNIVSDNPNLSHKEIGEMVGLSDRAVRSRLARMGLKKRDIRENNFEIKLKENGFEDKWEYGWLKTDKASIFIKNEKGFLSYEDIKDELIEEMKLYAPQYPKIVREKIKDEHLLIIDPADIHIGKLTLSEETGNEYNIQIAKQRCIDGVMGVLDKSKGFNINKILFIIGNDILHIDNPFRKTTAGTHQDTDGQWWQMFKEAKDLYVKIIEHLVTVADVEVIFCPSNHDYASGFMLADTISSWFSKSPNVSFNVDIIHRKYIKYGKNLLAFSHGDGARERDVKDLMADEVPKMWGETKFRYVYLHHIHHKKKINWQSGKDYIGVTVEYLRSPSGTDGWHNRNGYVSQKAVEGFIHSKDKGQVARITHYF